MEFLILIILLILCIFSVLYYIPKKLKALEEKQSLYVREIYRRINRLETKLDNLIDLNKNKM